MVNGHDGENVPERGRVGPEHLTSGNGARRQLIAVQAEHDVGARVGVARECNVPQGGCAESVKRGGERASRKG